MRHQIIDQELVNPADLERTTIVIYRKTVRRLEELGSHADTFDNILNRLVDYDIKLYGRGSQHNVDRDAPVRRDPKIRKFVGSRYDELTEHLHGSRIKE